MLICQYCQKECKNANSLCNHERLCKSNPNRSLTNYEKYGPISGFNNKGRISNRKGLKKETDTSIQQMIMTRNIHHEEGKFQYHRTSHTEETKQHLSDIAKVRGFGGKNYKSHFEYKGIKLDSSYELIVAQELDIHNVIWTRPSRIKYISPDGSYHHYTPDFYLPEYNVYLDPKNDFLINNINPISGYRDIEKINWVMKQNNICILILDKNHLDWKSIFDMIQQLQ